MKEAVLDRHNTLLWNILSLECSYTVILEASGQVLSSRLTAFQNKNKITLNITNFLLNGDIPDLLVDQMAHWCGEVLYPLTLTLTPERTIYKIFNYQEVKERWNKKKEELSRYYSDKYSRNYLHNTDAVYTLEKLLLHKLKNSPLFYLYFGGIYNKTFGEDLYREYTEEYQGVNYSFSQWINKELDENNCFSLYREGINESREEKLNLRYHIKNKDKTIQEAVFEFFKNGEVKQRLKLEISGEEKIEKIPEQVSDNKSFSFWIDEKHEN